MTPGPAHVVVPAAGPANPVARGAPNFLMPPSGGGGGGGGGGGAGGGGGTSVGNNITIVSSRRVVENNQNTGTNLSQAINSSVAFPRPPSSTQPASYIPVARRSPPSIVTPIVPLTSPPATLTSSAPLQQESVQNRIDPGRSATPRRQSRFSEYSPSTSAR